VNLILRCLFAAIVLLACVPAGSAQSANEGPKKKTSSRLSQPASTEFQYFEGTNFQAVKLWFCDAAMIVVLPDEDSSLPAPVDALMPDTWQQLERTVW
jgi:hypothetical protein